MGANIAPAYIIMGGSWESDSVLVSNRRSSETMKGLMVGEALMRPRYYAGVHEDNTLY